MLRRTLLFGLLLLTAGVIAQERPGLYSGKEDHSVTRADAAKYTRRFREANPGAVVAYYFGRQAIEAILAQPGVVGIRIYDGIADDGKPNRVLVGVDSQGNDIVDGELAEAPYHCPPSCGQTNPFDFLSGK